MARTRQKKARAPLWELGPSSVCPAGHLRRGAVRAAAVRCRRCAPGAGVRRLRSTPARVEAPQPPPLPRRVDTQLRRKPVQRNQVSTRRGCGPSGEGPAASPTRASRQPLSLLTSGHGHRSRITCSTIHFPPAAEWIPSCAERASSATTCPLGWSGAWVMPRLRQRRPGVRGPCVTTQRRPVPAARASPLVRVDTQLRQKWLFRIQGVVAA